MLINLMIKEIILALLVMKRYKSRSLGELFFMSPLVSPEICIVTCVDEILIFEGKRCFRYCVQSFSLCMN